MKDIYILVPRYSHLGLSRANTLPFPQFDH